jgi:prevent-host-death family protein
MSQPIPTESIRDARQHLAEIVDRAEHEGNPTVISRHGRQVAAVVPIEFLREYRILEEREVLRIINERRADDDGTRYTLEEIMAETLARPE